MTEPRIEIDRLRFFVDPSWRRQDKIHSMLMNPVWGIPKAKDNALLRTQLAERHTFDIRYYEIVDNPIDADIIFAPYAHREMRRQIPDLLPLCIKVAQDFKKPLLIDGLEDISHPIAYENHFVLRYGGYRFERTPREIILPPLANDLLEMYEDGTISTKKKGKVPIIGFAGWGKLKLKPYMRTIIKELPDRVRSLFDTRYTAKRRGVLWRGRVMRIIESSPEVSANFFSRRTYSGHAKTAEKSITELQREFIDNLLESNYGLDVRGDANASTRLFEILALGRIPVILDTERNFPFEDSIDYDAFSVRVDFRNVARLPSIVRAHFDATSEDEFEKMQKKAREAYETVFRIDALTSYLIRELKDKIQHLSHEN